MRLQEIVDVCHALGSNTNLKELYASGRHITPNSAAVIAEMLAKNCSLQRLCVGDHELGDSVSKHPVQCSL